MPQATFTTAVYDSKRKVLIPREIPSFTDIKDVVVVFFPKARIPSNKDDSWSRIMSLLEENWEYNRDKNTTEDEAMDIALQAQQSARAQKQRSK